MNGNCEILFKNRDECRERENSQNEKDGNVRIWYIRCLKQRYTTSRSVVDV